MKTKRQSPGQFKRHVRCRSYRARLKSLVSPMRVDTLVRSVLNDEFHSQQVLSLSNAVTGVVLAASLGIHAIGRALAAARGLDAKHAVKQVDRLLSNQKFELTKLFSLWVPHALGGRKEAVIALDWTEFARDGHSTIAAYLLTKHGRATPLCWHTVDKQMLADGGRTDEEDVLLMRLREVMPADVKVTLVADRGFGDSKLFELLDEWGWDYVIRIKKNTHVTDGRGVRRPVQELLPASGRATKLVHPTVTDRHVPVGAVVAVRAKDMKEPWFLVSSLAEARATEIIKLYGRRFTIEETFRDQKDPRFGLGMNHVRISKPERRDRLFFLATIAQALLTLLGAAGEHAGLDRGLKTNTSKARTLSLFRQGTFWFDALPNMKPDKAKKLIHAFGTLIQQHFAFKYALGCI